MVCRHLSASTEDAFGIRIFSSMKFMLTPWSLASLLKFSKEGKWGKYVRELRFGPERLNEEMLHVAGPL